MNLAVRASLLVTLATCLIVAPANAIALGQLDDFEDGTLIGWGNGGIGAAPVPMNIASGGPAGAGDNFLQIAADTLGGAGSRLTVFNRGQWLGNYIAAGVTAIEVDLRNLGSTNLSIRLAFKSSLNMSAPAYLTAPALLLSGSGWQHFTFSLAPGNLVAVAAPPPYNTLFSGGIAEVRFINEVGTTNSNGDVAMGTLGIDNIRTVPEPRVALLLLMAIGAIALRRARGFTTR